MTTDRRATDDCICGPMDTVHREDCPMTVRYRAGIRAFREAKAMTPANAPHVPPPDRPETMTAEDRDWVRGEQDFWANESRLMIDPEAALNSSRYLRILNTYAALEVVKAENARLKSDVQLYFDGLCAANDRATSLGNELAEAQKDSARFQWLATQRWWDVGSWAPRGFTNLIDAVDAARSGRKEADDA